MKAADSSVLIAAFASWHEGHAVAQRALRSPVRLPAHAALETYAVLTRLPPPHRAEGPMVASFLRAQFPNPPLCLAPAAQARLVDDAATRGIRGGAVYDALIGATAAAAGLPLLTRDRRAARTYEAVGVRFELIA